jgi:hypothetical protein
MGQDLIIAVLFAAAVIYLAHVVYKSFRARSGCSSGCGSCGIDFSKLQKELDKKTLK